MPLARGGSSKRAAGATRSRKKGTSAAAVAASIAADGAEAVTASCQVRSHPSCLLVYITNLHKNNVNTSSYGASFS